MSRTLRLGLALAATIGLILTSLSASARSIRVDSGDWLQRAGVEVVFEYGDLGDPHPNTYHLSLVRAGKERRLVAVSTGGGMIGSAGA